MNFRRVGEAKPGFYTIFPDVSKWASCIPPKKQNPACFGWNTLSDFYISITETVVMIEFLTALLVVITGLYAWVTYRILKSNERVVEVMRDQSEAAYRPYITVTPFVEPDNPIFYLRITNLGKTAAVDLRLMMDRPFFKFGTRSEDRDLSKYAVFSQIIDSFPPGSEIIFGLAQGFVVFADGADPTICPSTFTVTANYKIGAKRVKERHFIDLKPYLGAEIPPDPIIRKLKEINNSISKLTDTVKKSTNKN